MNKQPKKRKTNPKICAWLSNWRKNTACVITGVMCIIALVPVLAVPQNTTKSISAEEYENWDEKYIVPDSDMIPIEENSNTEGKPEENDSKAYIEANLQAKDFILFPDSKDFLLDSFNESNDGTEPSLGETQSPTEPTAPTEAERPTEPTVPAEVQKPTEHISLAETQKPTEPTKPAETGKTIESTNPAETKPKEEQQTTDPTTTTENQEQVTQTFIEPGENRWKIITSDLEAEYSSNEELEKVLNNLYVDCEHDPNWNLSASMKGEAIWIEQYEPLTEELIIGLGNLIFQETGGYISTQPYPISMKGYMLTGSVVLHRLELAYRGAKNVHDVVNSPSQYGAKWAFNRKKPVNGSVNECYIVAEMLLRNGPIGPRNLIGQSGGKQGDGTYWVIGENDCHYKPTYFCTNSKFADYEVIQTEEQEAQTEEPEVQTEEQEAPTEESEVQTEEQG